MQFKKYIIITLLLFIVLFNGIVFAQEIMKLSDIKPGMIGTAYTVFKGYEVEGFPVEVIDVLEDQGLDSSLILIKAGGARIDELGGIAAGMSGSPVYIDGKLIGAIGYGWSFTDNRYCLVTPIEDMLSLLEREEQSVKPANDKLVNLKSSLIISGLRGRALERLKRNLEPYGFDIIPVSGMNTTTSENINSNEIKPGSAIAVQLVRGDISVASIGTLTYRDGNDILAFGHPFLNKGSANYLLSKAHISTIIPSINFPFKIGSPDKDLLGSITVDAGAGIAGKLEKYPRIIPLRISVEDKTLNKKKIVNVQIVKNEELFTPLATNIALQSLDSILDRIGRGAARVKIKLTGNGLPDLAVEQENMFYSQQDIAALSLVDLYQLLNLITTNPFKEINLFDIKLDVEIDDSNSVALVQEAKVLNEKIYPGDTLIVEVTLHPYRQEPIVKTITLDLPEDIDSGMATIVIDGGFYGESQQYLPEDEGNSKPLNQAIIEGYKDFDSMLEDYLKQPLNNELIIQVYPSYPIAEYEEPVPDDNTEVAKEKNKENNERDTSSTVKKQEDEETQENKQENEEFPEIKKKVPTKYVLEGSLALDINIKGETKKNQEEEPRG